MKLFYLILPVVLLTQLIFATENVDKTNDFIKTNFSLLEIVNDINSSEDQKLEALIELAEGYEKFAEYNQMSKNFYKKVLRKTLPDDSPFKLKAVSELDRIKDLEEEYKHIDKYLFTLKVKSSKNRSDEEVAENISEIEKTIEDNPKYYNVNEMKFFLAKEYMNLEKFSKAQVLFKKILVKKPSIDLKIPISPLAKDNYKRWIKQRVDNFIRYSFLVLITILVVMFYISKPWKWVSWKHILYYLAMIVLWYVVYKLSLLILAKNFTFSDEIIKKLHGESPAYISSEVNVYAFPILSSFFNYVLVLLTGVFLFSLAVYRNKFRKISIILNIFYTAFLSLALFVTFSNRELKSHGKYYLENENYINYLSGHYFFRIPDMEAYILTNPERFTKLNRKSIKNKEFKSWVEENIPDKNIEKTENE
ncbi:MAG: hypothetical protein GQ534_12155 [Candidatus Delongbacteria bacterium]|nr:hypothetical protein [Candidatus Delongbacteria bacterium]